MTVLLDENQQKLISTKRLKPNQRPKYYNASAAAYVRISEDFEAFLILQGRPRNKETVDWLQKASSFAIQDGDRDSLVNLAVENEIEDAKAAADELAPVMNGFNRFRTKYNMTGFEGVTEAGQLLADLQRPMDEIITLGNRQKHRQLYAKLVKQQLLNKGVTSNQQKQINSWFESLTTY